MPNIRNSLFPQVTFYSIAVYKSYITNFILIKFLYLVSHIFMHENKRRRKYICILRHVLGNLRIILYRSTRDRLICSHALGLHAILLTLRISFVVLPVASSFFMRFLKTVTLLNILRLANTTVII